MKFIQEATYLAELENLCETMLLHAERFEEARQEWLQRRPRIASSRATQPSGGLTELGHSIAESIPLQGNMWVALEGFLTAWARASLMLFPATPRGKKAKRARAEARSSHLRDVLTIDDSHRLSDRGLRNSWMHFDEELDAALEEDGRVTPQRFVEHFPSGASPTMRMIVVAENCVVFRDVDSYSLEELFAAGRDLSRRVQEAKESAGDRHHEELSAPQPGEY